MLAASLWDWVSGVFWKGLEFVSGLVVGFLSWVGSLFGAVFPASLVVWYQANAASYVRTGGAFLDMIMDITLVVQLLATTVVTLITAVAVRALLFLYHQFHGAN